MQKYIEEIMKLACSLTESQSDGYSQIMRLCEVLQEEAERTQAELVELKTYRERMEKQFISDISNPLEPLKLSSALSSEICKYEYRKEHNPSAINILDYTIMEALRHCLVEQLAKQDDSMSSVDE